LETLNNGKAVEDSKGDIYASADCLEYCTLNEIVCIAIENMTLFKMLGGLIK